MGGRLRRWVGETGIASQSRKHAFMDRGEGLRSPEGCQRAEVSAGGHDRRGKPADRYLLSPFIGRTRPTTPGIPIWIP